MKLIHLPVCLLLIIASFFVSQSIASSTLTAQVISHAQAYQSFLNQQAKLEQENKERIQREKEEESISKAITRIYKHASLKEVKQIVKLTFKHAKKQKIKPTLAIGLIASESGFRKNAISSEGAVGYTQVLPKYHQDKIRGRNIYDMSVNIEVGMKILGDCTRAKKNLNAALGCYSGSTTQDKAAKYANFVRHNETKITHLAARLVT